MSRRSSLAPRERATGNLGADIGARLLPLPAHLDHFAPDLFAQLRGREDILAAIELRLANGEGGAEGSEALLFIEQEQGFLDDRTGVEARGGLTAENLLGLGGELDVHAALALRTGNPSP